MTLFGRRLEQLRDQKQLHNKDISQNTGLKPPEVTKIIKGELHKIAKIQTALDFMADNEDEVAELTIEWLLDHLLRLDRGIGLIEIRKLKESSDLVKKIKAAPLPHDVKEDLFFVIDDAMKHEATRRQIRIWTELIRLQKKNWNEVPVPSPKSKSSKKAKTSSGGKWRAVAEDPKKYEDEPSDSSS